MNKNFQDKKIAVIGLGGVGGYLGACWQRRTRM